MFFDKNGSGYIEVDELREALSDESGEIDADVLNDIIREVDTDKVPPILTLLDLHQINLPPISDKQTCFDFVGWSNQLRRVCCNDEDRNGLEKSISTVLEREIQEPKSQSDEGWLFTTPRRVHRSKRCSLTGDLFLR